MGILSDYPFYSVFAFIIFTYLGIYSLRFRSVAGSNFFSALMFLGAVLAVASFIELMSSSFAIKLWARNVQQIPIFLSSVAIYGLIMEFIGRNQNLSKKSLLIVTLPYLLFLFLIFTDQSHHLMRASIEMEQLGSSERLSIQPTTLSYGFMLYNLILNVYTLAALLISTRNASEYNRKQYWFLNASLLFMGISNFAKQKIPFLDSFVLMLIPAGLLLFWGLYRYKFLATWPIAKDKVIEHLHEGVAVIDSKGAIIDLNPAGRTIFSAIWKQEGAVPFVGRNAAALFKGTAIKDFYMDTAKSEMEYNNGIGHFYDIKKIGIGKKGMVLIFTDISRQKQTELELLRKINRDALTGIYNRQFMLDWIQENVTDMSSVSLLLLDIDHFKKVNDTFGHQTGDILIREIAEMMTWVVGDKGIVSRFGGEEFAILILPPYKEEALNIAETIRLNAENSVLFSHKNEPITATVSIGVGKVDMPSVPFEELFTRSDEALYISKRSGRNRITEWAKVPIQS